MPQAKTLAGWRAQVPPAFVFALKGPQRITHVKRLAGAAEDVAFFHSVAAELGDALGPVLWQLPPSLKKDLPRLREFLALLPGASQRFWLLVVAIGVVSGLGSVLLLKTLTLVKAIASVAQSGDLVVGLGAGTITDWMNALPQRLAEQRARA